MIIATVELVPRAGQRKAMLENLQYVRDHAAIWPDCLNSAVYEGDDESHRMLYLEQWKSERGLRAHIYSSPYRRLLHAMELSSEKPIIHFHEVDKSRSMELVEEVRGGL